MNTKIIINAVVSIILVMAVAIPIITQMAEDVHSVEYNTEARFFASESVSESVTYTYSEEGLLFNGALITGMESGRLGPVAMMDTALVMYSVNAVNPLVIYTGSDSDAVTSFTLNPDGTFEYVTSEDETGSGTYATVVNADPNGDYVAIPVDGTDETFGLNHGSSAYIFNRNYSSTTGNVINVVKTDGESSTELYSFDGTATSVSYNGVPTIITEGELSNIVHFDRNITINDNSVSAYQLVIIPYAYDVMTDMDGITKTLIGIIPVLLVVGIIIAVVYGSVLRRD